MNQPNLERNRTYLALKDIGSPYGALPKTDKNNFSPRLGMAWDLKGDGTSVVRGSYGLYYVMQIKNTYSSATTSRRTRSSSTRHSRIQRLAPDSCRPSFTV